MIIGVGNLECVHNILHRNFAHSMVRRSAKFSLNFMNFERFVAEVFTIDQKIKGWSVTFETRLYFRISNHCHVTAARKCSQARWTV